MAEAEIELEKKQKKARNKAWAEKQKAFNDAHKAAKAAGVSKAQLKPMSALHDGTKKARKGSDLYPIQGIDAAIARFLGRHLRT